MSVCRKGCMGVGLISLCLIISGVLLLVELEGTVIQVSRSISPLGILVGIVSVIVGLVGYSISYFKVEDLNLLNDLEEDNLNLF